MPDILKSSSRLSPPDHHIIAQALNLKTVDVEWLAGDGSDRCYYRIRDGTNRKSYVLMQLTGSDADALRENRYDWLSISELLNSRNIKVPRVVKTLPDHGALIIDDYGDTMLESLVLNSNCDVNLILPRYRDCFEALAQFLLIKPNPSAVWCRRIFDAERFSWELRFFCKKFLYDVLQFAFEKNDQESFDRDVKALSSYLCSLSEFFVHRDFHSRNVMVLPDSIAIIDFQDARLGPASYDLISLCFDSYVPFSALDRNNLFSEGIGVISKRCGSGLANRINAEWRPVFLQRQLKAIGSFGYLTVDKGRGDYLKNVSPALKTMEDQELFDQRWPFLSGKMLKMLRTLWDQRG